MYCSKCNEEITIPNAKFCKNCGAEIIQDKLINEDSSDENENKIEEYLIKDNLDEPIESVNQCLQEDEQINVKKRLLIDKIKSVIRSKANKNTYEKNLIKIYICLLF